jgi:hypothetical protein
MVRRSMFVGLDVHKDSIDISLAEEGRDGEVRHYGVIAGVLERAERAPRRRLNDVLGDVLTVQSSHGEAEQAREVRSEELIERALVAGSHALDELGVIHIRIRPRVAYFRFVRRRGCLAPVYERGPLVRILRGPQRPAVKTVQVSSGVLTHYRLLGMPGPCHRAFAIGYDLTAPPSALFGGTLALGAMTHSSSRASLALSPGPYRYTRHGCSSVTGFTDERPASCSRTAQMSARWSARLTVRNHGGRRLGEEIQRRLKVCCRRVRFPQGCRVECMLSVIAVGKSANASK